MTQIAQIKARWRKAVEEENSSLVETLVKEILTQHGMTALAAEIRYNRGVLNLTWGDGHGSERLAKAMAEFELGAKAADSVGESAEPWRSLLRSQLGACKSRLGNLAGATQELLAVGAYRPRTAAGLGALSLLTKLHKEAASKEAGKYETQRLSYARALVRENTGLPPETLRFYQFLLAQELLDSSFASEGEEILRELRGLGEATLGQEMYADVLRLLEQRKG